MSDFDETLGAWALEFRGAPGSGRWRSTVTAIVAGLCRRWTEMQPGIFDIIYFTLSL